MRLRGPLGASLVQPIAPQADLFEPIDRGVVLLLVPLPNGNVLSRAVFAVNELHAALGHQLVGVEPAVADFLEPQAATGVFVIRIKLGDARDVQIGFCSKFLLPAPFSKLSMRLGCVWDLPTALAILSQRGVLF